MTTLRAVDASFDPLTAAEAACLVNSDIPLFAQCLWTAAEQPVPRVTSLRNASNAGLMTAGYISLNRHAPGVWHVNRGRDGVPNDVWDVLKFVAVDVELDGIRVEDIITACGRVAELGQTPIIYTNFNTWANKIIPANSDWLALYGIPLWNAYWDGAPDIDFPHCRFGGWRDDQVMLEQWSGGTNVCGTFVDRNTVIRELLLAKEETMPTAEYDELKEMITNLGTVVSASANQLNGRLGGIESGEALSDIEVPIWGLGKVCLRDIFHRAIYSMPIRAGLAVIRAIRWLIRAADYHIDGQDDATYTLAQVRAADAAISEFEEASD